MQIRKQSNIVTSYACYKCKGQVCLVFFVIYLHDSTPKSYFGSQFKNNSAAFWIILRNRSVSVKQKIQQQCCLGRSISSRCAVEKVDDLLDDARSSTGFRFPRASMFFDSIASGRELQRQSQILILCLLKILFVNNVLQVESRWWQRDWQLVETERFVLQGRRKQNLTVSLATATINFYCNGNQWFRCATPIKVFSKKRYNCSKWFSKKKAGYLQNKKAEGDQVMFVLSLFLFSYNEVFVPAVWFTLKRR